MAQELQWVEELQQEEEAVRGLQTGERKGRKMTTVAFKDGQMAADTCCPGWVNRRARKVHKVGDLIVGLAGHETDCLTFLDWLRRDQFSEPNFRNYRGDDDAPDFAALIWRDNQLEYWTEYLTPVILIEPFFSIGSGSQAAMGAMHMGATAQQAVQIAAAIDVNTDIANGIDIVGSSTYEDAMKVLYGGQHEGNEL